MIDNIVTCSIIWCLKRTQKMSRQKINVKTKHCEYELMKATTCNVTDSYEPKQVNWWNVGLQQYRPRSRRRSRHSSLNCCRLQLSRPWFDLCLYHKVLLYVESCGCASYAPQTDMEDRRNPSIKKSLFPLFSSKNSLKHNAAVKVLPVVASPMVQHQPTVPYPASPVIPPRHYGCMERCLLWNPLRSLITRWLTITERISNVFWA